MRFSSRSALYRLLPVALLALTVLAGCGRKAQRPANVLSERERTELGMYESIRADLASDDLRAAQRHATNLAEAVKPASPKDRPDEMYAPAQALAGTNSLDRARDQFRQLSVAAIRLGGDVTGYYVMTSPMASNGDWLQTNLNVDNPYLGKVLHDCGGLKK